MVAEDQSQLFPIYSLYSRLSLSPSFLVDLEAGNAVEFQVILCLSQGSRLNLKSKMTEAFRCREGQELSLIGFLVRKEEKCLEV